MTKPLKQSTLQAHIERVLQHPAVNLRFAEFELVHDMSYRWHASVGVDGDPVPALASGCTALMAVRLLFAELQKRDMQGDKR